MTNRVFALALVLTGCRSLPAPREPAETTGRVGWEFAGLAAVPQACEAARARDTLVLVGLSGSPG
jgi:hypothetical protein